ncbi:MAG: DUF4105 domain-containing protein [Candidatus Margulisiibacteriota bacterium]
MIRYILFFFLFSIVVLAESSAINQLLKEANSRKLGYELKWKQLLGYNTGSILFHKSDVKSEPFFLAKDGRTNPVSELNKTIRSYFAPLPKDQNDHPQCRFPARYIWLERQLGIARYPHPKPNCNLYNEFRNNEISESISLLYVGGYFSNPSSFYGHLLLKFNQSTPLYLNTTVNYGAIVPPNESPVMYIAKGIMGGYDSTYSDQRFYRYNHNYVEDDLRDIWEYKLNLTPYQRELLTAHTWEMLGEFYTYYFFRDNCAYRVAKLVDLVIEDSIIPKYTPWTLPYQIIVNANQVPGLVSEVNYIPSRENRFIQLYERLTIDEQVVFKEILKQHNFDSNEYKLLTTDQKINILNVLIEYLGFLSVKNTKDKPSKILKQKVSLERIKLPPSTMPPQFKGVPIHKSQPSSLIEVSNIQNNGVGGLGLRFRATNYDALSINTARIPNATIEMMDFKIDVIQNEIKFDYLTFINVVALNTSRTGLRGDGGLAWSLQIGIDQDKTMGLHESVFFTEIGLGKSMALGLNSVGYGILAIQFQGGEFPLGISPKVGFISKLSNHWKLQAELAEYFYNDQKLTLIKSELRYSTTNTSDFRIQYKKSFEDQIKFSRGIYW